MANSCSNQKRTAAKLSENWSFLDQVGDEIVFDILTRLPAKAAVRFKAVCKRFCTLISDSFVPCFTNRPLQQVSYSVPNPLTLVFQFDFFSLPEFLPSDLDRVQIISEHPSLSKFNIGRNFDLRFLLECPSLRNVSTRPWGFELEASCDDLLLCSYTSSSKISYCVCDVLAKKGVALPPIQMDSMAADISDIGFFCESLPRSARNQIMQTGSSGASTNSSINARYKYTILRIPEAQPSEMKIQIFSSEKRGWQSLRIDSSVRLSRLFRFKNRMVVCNGNVHYLTQKCVVAFEPFRNPKVPRIIALPSGLVLESGSLICFGVSCGRLRVSIVVLDYGLNIWELEDYVNGKWCSARFIPFKWHFYQVLAFHPNNENIIYLKQGRDLIECDIMHQKRLKPYSYRTYRQVLLGDDISWLNTFWLMHSVQSEMANSCGNLSFLDHLEDKLLLEILTRLPGKALIRCKAVSKRFCTLITDSFVPRFTDCPRQVSCSVHNPLTLVFQFNFFSPPEFLRGDIDRIQIISEHPLLSKFNIGRNFDMGFLPKDPISSGQASTDLPTFELEASCTDLLLCSYTHSSPSQVTYCICNVLTKEWVALPPIPLDCKADIGFFYEPVPCSKLNQKQSGSLSAITTEFSTNAGYKYWILRIPNVGSSKTDIQIFSSEKGEWEMCMVDSRVPLIRLYHKTHMSVCHGMLLYLTQCCIVAFKPFCKPVEVTRIISLPSGLILDSDSPICFGMSCGRLRFGMVIVDYGLYVWELKDYENGEWCLASCILFKWQYQLLAFHPNNKNIIYLKQGLDLIECDKQQIGSEPSFRTYKHILFGDISWLNTFWLQHHVT